MLLYGFFIDFFLSNVFDERFIWPPLYYLYILKSHFRVGGIPTIRTFFASLQVK